MISLFLAIALAGPWPPHKHKSKIKPDERSKIEEKCAKYGGESFNKCIEIEKKKLDEEKSKKK